MSVNKRYFDFNKDRKSNKQPENTITRNSFPQKKLNEEELEKITDEIVKELHSAMNNNEENNNIW